LGEDNAAERRKGSRANVRAQYNLASSSSFKRLGILSCSANSPRHIPRSTLEPEAARQKRDSPRGVFARRQMCFLRLSEMFGRARARPHKRSMIQCWTPGPDRPSADKEEDVHLFGRLWKSVIRSRRRRRRPHHREGERERKRVEAPRRPAT